MTHIMKKFLLLYFLLGCTLITNAQEKVYNSTKDTLFVSNKVLLYTILSESCVEVIGENVTFSGSTNYRLGFNKSNAKFKVIADSITLPPTETKSIYVIQDNPTITFELGYLSSPIICDGTNKTLNVNLGKGVFSINEIQCDSLILGNNTSLRCKLFTTNKVLDVNEDEVYEVKLPHNGSQSFTVQKNDGTGYVDYIDYSFDYFHKDNKGNDDPAYYIYLPNGDYRVTTGSEKYTFTVDGVAVNLALKPAMAGNGMVDLSAGEFSFIEGGYQIADQPYTYEGSNGYTFTGTTANTITIPDDFPLDAITLSDVYIDRYNELSNDPAITIEKSGDFEVILNGKSQIKGSSYGDNKGNGDITYTGDGTLTLNDVSVDNSDTLYLYKSLLKTDKLIIKGGAIFSEQGAVFLVDTLIIDAGVVSCYHIKSTTFVNGGTFVKYNIQAFDPWGHVRTDEGAIGNITFNGGTSYIQLWNAKFPGIDENVKINGGSVCITNHCNPSSCPFNGTYRFASDNAPTRTGGTDVVYQSIFKLPVAAGTAVDSIKVDGVLYPSNGVVTDTASSVYLWLPETKGDDFTNTSIFIDGAEFKFGGYIDVQFEYKPYTDIANPGQGNKQEIMLVSTTDAENGSYAVSGDYTTEYNNTLYACSNTKLSVATTPDENYKLDSIAVNGKKLSGTEFSVVRPDQSIAEMVVSATFEQIIVSLSKTECENGSFELAGGITDSTATSGTEITVNVTANEGYELGKITVNGTDLAQGVTTFTADAAVQDMAVSVTFVAKTGINFTEANNVRVFATQNQINIQNAENATVQVFNVSGAVVYSAQNVNSQNVEAEAGVYIVVVDGVAYKVAVK